MIALQPRFSCVSSVDVCVVAWEVEPEAGEVEVTSTQRDELWDDILGEPLREMRLAQRALLAAAEAQAAEATEAAAGPARRAAAVRQRACPPSRATSSPSLAFPLARLVQLTVRSAFLHPSTEGPKEVCATAKKS